jgi:hypothetical protein
MAFNLATAKPIEAEAPARSGFNLATAKPVEAPSAPTPGWFEPGSKSEAIARGFSQGATLGFGDEIQALLRTIGDDRTYAQLRDEERAANAAAQQANPGAYTASNIAGAAPAYLAAGGPAALAAVGGVQGLGGAEGTVGEQALQTGIGAGTGAVIGAGGKLLKQGAIALANKIAPTGPPVLSQIVGAMKNPGPVGAAEALSAFRESAARVSGGGLKSLARSGVGAAGGAAIAPVFGQDPLLGAAVGAGFSPIGKLGTDLVIKGIKQTATSATKAVAGVVKPTAQLATTAALTEMSKPQQKKVVKAGNATIVEQVDRGTPKYAATFTQLQDPAYRQAVNKEQEDDKDEDDDED